MFIVCITADSAQINLLSIYIISLDKDNDTSALNSLNTDDSLKKYIFNDSDNTSEDFSFCLYKYKSALKIKVKGKSCITSASVIKK